MTALTGLGAFFIGFGLLFVCIGIAAMRRNDRFERRGVRVPGVVTGLRRGSTGTSPSSPVDYAVLWFRLLDGRQVTVESFFGTWPPRWQPGERVTVIYDGRDPSRARVDEPGRTSLGRYWPFPVGGVAFALVGTVLITVG